MNRPKDPALMTPRERVAEIGSLLARGYRRSLLNQLADCPPNEPSCDSVNTPKTKEVA